MAKFIEITSQNGYIYQIPAEVVADNRAKHYADDPDSSYQEEYDYTLSSDFELMDWFGNNMDWEDVEDHAVVRDVPKPELDVPIIGQDEAEIVNV